MIEVDVLNKPLTTYTWDAPVEREDGTAITGADIAGYRFYWGSAPGDYMNQIDAVTNTVSLDFNALPLPMYAVLTSIDIDGRESVYSAPIDFIKKSYALKAPTNFRELLES